MKTGLLKLGIFSMLFVAVSLTSCSEDEPVSTDSTSTDLVLVEETKQASEADMTIDGVFNMLDVAYVEIEENEGRNESLFSDCVTITISLENGITFVTLDFGFGCELQNGAIVSGLVHITYGPVQNGTRTINFTFENFVWNNKGVEGGGTIFRERNNAAGNPQSTYHLNLNISFPNGLVITGDGTRVVEWIEGVGSGTWTDNVYLVTGNRTIVSNTGFTHYGVITEALRHEAGCPFFVSGVAELTRNGTTGILDFGDGTCDNIAILTVNGVDHVIILN